jgi:hypothetical protein
MIRAAYSQEETFMPARNDVLPHVDRLLQSAAGLAGGWSPAG